MKREYYVYAHRKASDGFVFYIGKGKSRRAWSKVGRNKYWRRIETEHGFWVDIIKENMPEVCALSLERAVIFSTGKKNLCNLRSGGYGSSDWHHSDEAKAKISAFNKGKKPTPKALAALRTNAGKPMSEAQKKKLSLAKIGIKRGPTSEETKKKISKSHMGLRPSKDTLVKMSLSKIGKSKGKLSPSYDHTVREFYKDNGEIFVGTRGEFIEMFGPTDGCVSHLINGKRKTVKGWRIR